MPSRVTVAGCVSDPEFHRCCAVTSNFAGFEMETIGMFDTQWEEYITRIKRGVGGKAFEHTAKHVVLLDDGKTFLGGADDFVTFLDKSSPSPAAHEVTKKTKDWAAIALEQCKGELERSGNCLVFMDIALGPDKRPERVVFQLYTHLCPKTCENFRALCTGEKGKAANGKRLSYKGSPFHRVVPDGWVQGGDIISGAGDGGISIHGECFADETFTVAFDQPGILAMANDGPHTNGSQFFITLAEQPWLNHKAVGFGRQVKG
ncbi:unnamed protein product, partial [Discosporangium mesarthrocarpum]